MKKMFLLVAASMLMFACSQEKNDEGLPEEKGMVIELSAVNETTDGFTTRTRPLYSQEAVQEVERVNVFVFMQSGSDYLYTKTYNIPNWTKGNTFARYAVPANNKLAAGTYRFLVVGQEATDNYKITTPVVNVTSINSMIAHVSAAGMESEIFAGVKDVVVSSAGVRVVMQMTRQVAGVLGYFKNVPTTMNGQPVKYLRLTVSNADTSVLLSSGNGTSSLGVSYNIIDVDISGQAQTVDGVYVGNDLSAQGVVKVANSELYGKFLLPVGNITMKLGLYDQNNVELKSWSVIDGNNSTFNISANHFYSLGRKVSKTDTTGGNTPDTGDDDGPIDLLLDQSIAITIDPSWNILHNLTIQ